MRIDLAGKPIAITGASSGIGWTTALACAKAGMPVALGARRVDRLKKLEAEIKAMGGRAISVETDVGDKDQCRRFIDATCDAFGGIYSVFANAGYGHEGTGMGMPDADLEAIIRVNFWGTLWTIRPAVEHMLNAGSGTSPRGHVLIDSSCVSKIGLPHYFAYSATKAMQDHLGRAMRIELASKGIHVSTIHPIGTRTDFSSEVAARGGGSRESLTIPDRKKQSPELVAAAIVRCLRKPKGEVWTHLPMRLTLALATAWPGLADRILLRRHKAKGRA